jgi:predicted AlkP superfamily pyrophosphatase or phosphodiesterase
MLRSFILVVACAAFLASGLAAAEPVKHVVLVSIDGLAAEYLTDPKSEIPNLKKLMAEGASAKGMLTTFPSVTWPSHTTLVTGVTAAKHGVIGNTVWDRKKNQGLTYIGDPTLEKDQAIRVPTIYDLATNSGLTSAGVIWPCVNGAKTLKFAIPDAGKPEQHAKYTTPGLVDELGAAGIDISKLGEWGWSKEKSIERDNVYTQTAIHLLEKHQVNLLLVHLITLDGSEHSYGPFSREAFKAVAEADVHVGEIWAALQKPPFQGSSTLFVVSDHGFAPVGKLIRPNAVFKEMGLIKTDDMNKPTERQVWCVAQGGSAFIYILDAAHEKELTDEVKTKLAKLEGVKKIITPDKYDQLGLPQPADNSEAPQFVLLTEPGYSFNDALTLPVIDESKTLLGTHGHSVEPSWMHATFIAAGAGIKPAKLDLIRNVDVAPTMAKLMGLEMKNVDGKVLDILK